MGCQVVKQDGSDQFENFEIKPSDLVKGEKWWTKEANRKTNAVKLLEAMTSCTGITSLNGRLIGDPLDVEMFKSTAWILDEPMQTEGTENVLQYLYPSAEDKEQYAVGLLRRFDFTAALMRSSVVCRDQQNNFSAFVKGSPERIKDLCIAQLPQNYDQVLEQFTKEGYRVIALATKQLNDFSTT